MFEQVHFYNSLNGYSVSNRQISFVRRMLVIDFHALCSLARRTCVEWEIACNSFPSVIKCKLNSLSHLARFSVWRQWTKKSTNIHEPAHQTLSVVNINSLVMDMSAQLFPRWMARRDVTSRETARDVTWRSGHKQSRALLHVGLREIRTHRLAFGHLPERWCKRQGSIFGP